MTRAAPRRLGCAPRRGRAAWRRVVHAAGRGARAGAAARAWSALWGLGLLVLAASPALAERATLRAARLGAPPLVLQAQVTAEHWVISVQEGGIETQRIEVQTDLPGIRPRLADADGDGAADLFVPVIGGNANSAWDVWIQQPGQARFRRGGEVNGLAFARDGRRLLSLARDGCCGQSIIFHDIGPDGALREAFAVDRRMDSLGRGPCEGVPIAIAPPPATVRAACALSPGRLPGVRLAVP
jgi:hypothetical protein